MTTSYNYNSTPIVKKAFNIDVNNNIKELNKCLTSLTNQMVKYNSIMNTISNHNEHKHLEEHTNAMKNLSNNLDEFIKLYNGSQEPYENNNAEAVLSVMDNLNKNINKLSLQIDSFIDYSKDNQILLNMLIKKLNDKI